MASISVLENMSLVGYLDLNKAELRNAKIQNLASAPGSPTAGQVYFNTGTNQFFVYNGSGFVTFYPSTTTLDQITAPAADVSLNSHKITNLASPVSGTDAANKNYVDQTAAGLSWKQAVRAATTANVTLSGTQTVDGVSLIAGDRVLVKSQSAGAENGLYEVAAGSWTRTTDADSGAELVGAAVSVTEGTANANTQWTQTTDAPITLGTTGIVWAQFGGSSTYTAGDALGLTGNEFDVLTDGTTIGLNGSNQLEVMDGVFGRMFIGTISGNSSNTTFTLTHGFNSKAVSVTVRGTSSPYTDEIVLTGRKPNGVDSVDITFATAPAVGVNFEVTIIG